MHAPLIISGPSGVGKSYLEKHLTENFPFSRIVSTTTRPPRPGEKHLVDYRFVNESQYQEIEAADGFVTSSSHLDALYGFEKNLVEEIQSQNRIPVTVVVPTVVERFIQAYPQTRAIYLMPINQELLLSRMRQRGDREEKILERLEREKEQTEYFQQHIQHYYTKILSVTGDNFQQIIAEIISLYPTAEKNQLI